MSFNVKYGTDLILLMDVSAANDGSEYKAVAHATSHSLEFGRNNREISSKSTGDYVGSSYGKAKWSISADALISYDFQFRDGIRSLESYGVTKTNITVLLEALNSSSAVLRVAARCAFILAATLIEMG